MARRAGGAGMISVVVCTRNRADSLERTLRALAEMAVPPSIAWEIVVVDNGSADRTAEVVADAARRLAVPVRAVREDRPGLSRARNAGVRAARGSLIAFTDDDCRVDPHWLARIEAAFVAEPSLHVLTGRVELHDARDRPVGVRLQREAAALTSFRDVAALAIGCNMACRRAVFDGDAFFDVRLGAGTRIPSAEDWDFVYRALKAGRRVAFSPDVLVRHAHGRRSEADVDPLRRGYVVGRWALYSKYALQLDSEVVRAAARELAGVLGDIGRGRRSLRVLAPVGHGVFYWLMAGGSRE